MEAEAEIEALQSIFGDDITVEANSDRSVTVVRRKVRPNGEEGVSSASVVAEFELSLEYPEVSPTVRLLNPRGISEQSHQRLIEEVRQLLSENIGMPIIYDILQHCADFILEHQHSSSLPCPICLCPMTSTSIFGTPCDHYVHSECYELYVEYTRKILGDKLLARDFKMCNDLDRSLRCPVCREVIQEEIEPLLQPSPPPRQKNNSSLDGSKTTPCDLFHQGSECDFDFDWKRWREQQESLMKIYQRQKEKGGIIDLEEERKKNLITEDTVVVLGSEMGNLDVDQLSAGEPGQPPEFPVTQNADVDLPPSLENTLQANATSNTFRRYQEENICRCRGGGGGRRTYTRRPHEGGRYEYRSQQRRDVQEKVHVAPSSNAIPNTEAVSAPAECKPEQSVEVRRADRFPKGIVRQHQRGRGRWRRDGSRGRGDQNQRTRLENL